MGVLSKDECEARQQVMLEHYVGTVEIEAKCMVVMLRKHVIPSAINGALHEEVTELQQGVIDLEASIAKIHAAETPGAAARIARELRLEQMEAVRAIADFVEADVPALMWNLPTYADMLFLDQTTNDASMGVESY